MSSGHSTRFLNDRTSLGRMETHPPRRAAQRAWRILDPERRLASIEKALRPSDDCLDGFPLAL